MYGMIRNTNRFTGKPQPGCYSTPDGIGHVERAGSDWHAWRTDTPGTTAICDTLREAAQFAHYAH